MLEQLLSILESIPGELAFGSVIFVLLICGLGLPLPEEFPLIAAGYLAQQGAVSLETAIISCLWAIIVGDSMLFWIGRKLGTQLFKIRFFRSELNPERLEKVNTYFHRYGSRVVFVARFMAGVRGTAFLAAGMFQMPYRKFIALDGLAALVSVPVTIWIAYHFGEEIDYSLKMIRKMSWTMLVTAAIGILIFTLGVSIFRRRKQLLLNTDLSKKTKAADENLKNAGNF